MKRNERGWRMGEIHPKVYLTDHEVDLMRSTLIALFLSRDSSIVRSELRP